MLKRFRNWAARLISSPKEPNEVTVYVRPDIDLTLFDIHLKPIPELSDDSMDDLQWDVNQALSEWLSSRLITCEWRRGYGALVTSVKADPDTKPPKAKFPAD